VDVRDRCRPRLTGSTANRGQGEHWLAPGEQ
jgi:hypothetical protein